MQPNPGWPFNEQNFMDCRTRGFSTVAQLLPEGEAQEIMVSWLPGSPIVTEAAMWYEDYLDKVTRIITIAHYC